jgi:hypothetical protein
VKNEAKPWIENYLSGGRHYQALDVSELREQWYAAGNRARTAEARGNNLEMIAALQMMDDVEAEFNLRGLKAPGPRQH